MEYSSSNSSNNSKKTNASFVMLAKMCRGEYFCKKKTNYNNNGKKIIYVVKEWSCFLMQFCDGVCTEAMQKKYNFAYLKVFGRNKHGG